MRTLWERTREVQAGRVMRRVDRTPEILLTIEAADIDEADIDEADIDEAVAIGAPA